MEIERKWLLTQMPRTNNAFCAEIYQSYLASGNIEVRFRKKVITQDARQENTNPFTLTIKSIGNLSREEVNIPISEEEYETFLRIVNRTPIHKLYKWWIKDGKKIECSIVDKDWIYAEVEFDSVEEAQAYVFPYPDLVIDEVTYFPQYKMKNYWNRTRQL